DHQPFIFRPVRAGDLDRAWVRLRVVDVFSTTGGEDAADDSGTGNDFGGLDLFAHDAHRDNRSIAAAAGLGQKDRAVVAVKEILGVLCDPVHDLLEIER